jgi:hypothetical protein
MRRCRLFPLVLLVGACGFDRDRPEPVEPEAEASLSVEVLSPRTGEVLGAGSAVVVEVSARDLTGEHLHGIGFVARRSGSGGNATLDSVVESTGARAQAVREFTFAVPAGLPVNTQVDVFGLAFGPGSQSRVSVARSVTVISCGPGVPGC